MQVAPYGTWPSPLTPDAIVAGSVRLGDAAIQSKTAYWTEGRPTEAGRMVLVRQFDNGAHEDLTPAPYSVRTRVHEYGGRCFAVAGETAWFSNDADGRVYSVNLLDLTIKPLTPESNERFADLLVDVTGERLIAVREIPRDGEEPENDLVSIGLSSGVVSRLAGGHDFYSTPRVNPAGDRLSFITWDHPCMPWDGTRLWELSLSGEGAEPQLVAGGDDVAIAQPEYGPDGRLYFVTDESGWWNIFVRDDDGHRAVYVREAEFAKPHWVFGMTTYGFLSNGQIGCMWASEGVWTLGVLDPDDGQLSPLDLPFSSFDGLVLDGMRGICVAGAADKPGAVIRVDFGSDDFDVIRASSSLELEAEWISTPESMRFPSDGYSVHAFYYPPTSATHCAGDGEAPPLIVIGHGGPTSSTSAVLDARVQFWTTRGFAVVDVNYRGSTGFGRAYRDALKANWGVADVSDCVNAALHLAEVGKADGERLIIRGGSAGGFTALAALCFHNVFAAAASYYGISELEALATDTHKFESRYLDSLIGPYPERKDLYVERSPINHIDKLSCPAIFFQGLEDKVVPPNQAEMMVDALRDKGQPVAYLAFEGEQHGFRQASTIKATLSSELNFYGKVLGFQPAGEFEPLAIDNL